MRPLSNLACLGLLALLISVAGCRSVPAPDAPKGCDYPERTASPEAGQLLKQIQTPGVHDPKTDLLLLRRYVLLCPWDVQLWESLASDEFEAHQYQLALNEYLALLKCVRNHDIPQWDFNIENQSRIWNGIGHCYLELHQPDKALEYYRKVGEYEESFYTHYNFARTYIQLKDYCSASYHLELMETWLPSHQDYINEIKSQIPEDPCRHRPGAN